MGDKRKKRGEDADPEMIGVEDAAAETDGRGRHPEEMRASVTLQIGDRITFTAAARATPAGIIAGGLALTAIMVPLIWISRAVARSRRA